MKERTFWVYLMASRKGGAIYVGVTSDLARRAHEHRKGIGAQHTSRYRIRRLVYAEPHATALEAISREKRLKKWKRAWKVALIEEANANWDDLTEVMVR